MSEFKPGFYIDPTNPDMLRHFNGSSWDSITKPRGLEGDDVFEERYTIGPDIPVEADDIFVEKKEEGLFEEPTPEEIANNVDFKFVSPWGMAREEVDQQFVDYSTGLDAHLTVKNDSGLNVKNIIAILVLIMVYSLGSIISLDDAEREYLYNKNIGNQALVQAKVINSQTVSSGSSSSIGGEVDLCTYKYEYFIGGVSYQGSGSRMKKGWSVCIPIGGNIDVVIDEKNPIISFLPTTSQNSTKGLNFFRILAYISFSLTFAILLLIGILLSLGSITFNSRLRSGNSTNFLLRVFTSLAFKNRDR